MTTFNPLEQNLDVAWLLENGWTISGNMAYRHILHEQSQGNASIERIEQLLIQYDALDQAEKIKEALAELLELKKIFSGLGK